MSILIKKSKLKAFLVKGSEEDIKIFSEAIESAINFYLAKETFTPINQDQAGNIYFLKRFGKSLQLEKPNNSKSLGEVVAYIPFNDLSLLYSFQKAFDNTLQDLLNHGAEHTLSKQLSEAAYFISLMRQAISPSLEEIGNDLRKSIFN